MIRDFFKRLFGKKEITPATVWQIQSQQPITDMSPLPSLAATPESKPKTKKPRVAKPKSSDAVHLTAWPFEDPQPTKTKNSKSKQKKVPDETAKTVAAISLIKKTQKAQNKSVSSKTNSRSVGPKKATVVDTAVKNIPADNTANAATVKKAAKKKQSSK